MKEIIRYGLVLGIICFLASSVLAVVNGLTEPEIELRKEREESAALREVLPAASTFEPILKDGKINFYSAYDGNNALVGFVIKGEGQGYSSTIEILAGLDRNLEINNIKILSQNETPGLGSRITEADFQDQFKGKDLRGLDDVQAITGATISSSAVINSIKDKISELKSWVRGE